MNHVLIIIRDVVCTHERLAPKCLSNPTRINWSCSSLPEICHQISYKRWHVQCTYYVRGQSTFKIEQGRMQCPKCCWKCRLIYEDKPWRVSEIIKCEDCRTPPSRLCRTQDEDTYMDDILTCSFAGGQGKVGRMLVMLWRISIRVRVRIMDKCIRVWWRFFV